MSVTNHTRSRLLASAKSLAARFGNDKRGSFVPVFAISMTALMLSAGAAFDYSQIMRSKVALNGVVDAAILATGNSMGEGETDPVVLETIFTQYFQSNVENGKPFARDLSVEEFNADPVNGRINVQISGSVDTAFFSIAGLETVKIHSGSEVTFSKQPVEVAMMLDVTGSMGDDGKLDSLTKAAGDAIDILIPAGSASSKVRIGLVPYSESVDVGESIALKASGQKANTCLVERSNNASNDKSWKQGLLKTDSEADCPVAKMRPLTSNRWDLKDDLAGYHASGWTAGHLGIQWSYYMLSENWKTAFPVSARPADYDAKAKKIAILMTDGEFNSFYDGMDKGSKHETAQAKAKSNKLAKDLCDDMKALKSGNPGITIYSVGFHAPSEAKEMLEYCASGSTNYFDANSETELRDAFRKIARSIKTLRLSR